MIKYLRFYNYAVIVMSARMTRCCMLDKVWSAIFEFIMFASVAVLNGS